MSDDRWMAQVPANGATFWRRAPLHVGFGEISIQTLRIAPRSIVLVTKHLKVHGSPLAPMRTQSPCCECWRCSTADIPPLEERHCTPTVQAQALPPARIAGTAA